MKTSTVAWNLDQLYRKQPTINPKPQYQRTPVWSESKKQLLLDSVLRGYDVPKFYVRSVDDSSPFEFEVIDGQQRIRAFWEFFSNEYPLGPPSEDLPFGDLSGKYFQDLDSPTQDTIGTFMISIVVVDNANDLQVTDLFQRLQEGVALTPPERRNAMLGKMHDFIADLAETHRVFPSTAIKKKRFTWDDLAAIVTRIELSNGPTDVQAVDLRKMYQDENSSFNSKGAKARKIQSTLTTLSKILKDQPPEMNIKWGFVDLYSAVSALSNEFKLSGRESEMANFYVGFETQRRANMEDPMQLISNSANPWDLDLYHYIGAFRTEGGKRKNIEVRHNVYRRRILDELRDLTPKDPTRSFTHEERIIIWRRDKGKCRSCKTSVTIEEMHADHIIPHSHGGETTIGNGQALCGTCNLKKGAINQPQTT